MDHNLKMYFFLSIHIYSIYTIQKTKTNTKIDKTKQNPNIKLYISFISSVMLFLQIICKNLHGIREKKKKKKKKKPRKKWKLEWNSFDKILTALSYLVV